MKYLLIILLLSSCYTARKAKSDFSRATLAYPQLGAEFCKGRYPVRAKTDSTEYKNSKHLIDSLSNVLFKDSLINGTERERLMNEIRAIRNSIKEPENCDSLSEGIYRLAAKEQLRGDKFEASYYRLIAAANNIKPVHDTVPDLAAIHSLQLQLADALTLSVDNAKASNKWEAKSKRHFNWFLVACGLLGVGIFLRIKRIL